MSIVTSASTVGSRGHHGAIPYILTMKAINPRTNKPEDYAELISDDTSLIRFSDGSIVPKKDVEFENTFDGFVESINAEDFPELDLKSLLFFIGIQVVTALALFTAIYWCVQGGVWLVQKMV